MNEGTLKTKWTRHARKNGLLVKSLSPHQIPGLPDLAAIDKASSEVMRNFQRVKIHFIEAKVWHNKPNCFDARRDATAKQVEWLLTWHSLGCPMWWLILSPDKWMLVPATRLLVNRTAFTKSAKKYGAAISDLHEPESPRLVLAADTDKRLDRRRLDIAEMFS